jgi:hypothetical protein
LSVDLLAPSSTLVDSSKAWRQPIADFWDQLGQGYIKKNIDVWNQSVPFECTNNPDIAYRYAKLITHYILDCQQQGFCGKFVLLECGVGLGQFAYLFLTQLLRNIDTLKIPRDRIHYIMCDHNEKTRHFWHQHPQFGALFKSGIVSSAHFHMHGNLTIDSELKHDTLTKSRLIFIANYFLDSLPQTPFQNIRGNYTPCKITKKTSFFSKKKEHALQFSPMPYAKPPFGQTDSYDVILNQHHDFELSHLLMPDGAMKIIQWLSSLNASPILFLATDKGFTDFTYDTYGDNFDIIHTGMYASCVNFFAIDAYVKNVFNGSSCLAPADHVTLSSNVFLTREKIQKLPAFYQEAQHFSQYFSSNRRLHTQRLLEEPVLLSDIESLLLQLEESHHDPCTLHRIIGHAEACVKNAPNLKHFRLDNAINSLRAHYYFTPHDQSQNQMVCIIHLALAGQRFEIAKNMIDQFGKWHGENYFFKRMQGTLYFLQSDFTSAAHFFLEALRDNPDCTYSKDYLGHCEAII